MEKSNTSAGRRKREPLPWFPAYPLDWLESETVTAMTLEQQGLYWRYICIHMRQGGIPTDPAMRAKFAGIPPRTERRLWPAIALNFAPDPEDETRLVNAKCVAVQAQQDAMRDLQSRRRSGKESGVNPDSIGTESELSRGLTPTQLELKSDSVAVNHVESTKRVYRGSTSQSQSHIRERKEEDQTRDLSANSAAESLSVFQSESTDDDRPDADAGSPDRWKPSPADATSLAGLMAESTGKTDPPFAQTILELAAEGAATSYADVEAHCRDAVQHASKPPTSNGFFQKAVQSKFAPDAPIIGPATIKALANGLSMNRAPSAAQREANLERNRQQLAELQAKHAASNLGPGYEEFQRANEARTKGAQ